MARNQADKSNAHILSSNGPRFADVDRVQHLLQILTQPRLYYKHFLNGPVNVPQRDKPNRESWTVWSAQGVAAQFIGRAEG